MVLLLVIGGIGYLLPRSPHPEIPPDTSKSAFEATGDPTQREDTWVRDIPRNDVLITMKDGKYFPADATVEAGMTVAFANEDPEADYWPVSQDYPDVFDVSSAMPPGSYWSFTAAETGTYTFSDKLHPDISGWIKAKAPQE